MAADEWQHHNCRDLSANIRKGFKAITPSNVIVLCNDRAVLQKLQLSCFADNGKMYGC
jgi:hypothetical protein